MNIVIPKQAEEKLELLRQAARLSSVLRDFMAQNVPGLADAEDDELLFITEQHTAAMTRLKAISELVETLNLADNITPEFEPQCEQLRLETRENLASVAVHLKQFASIVEQRKAVYQRELLWARKRQNISAYLQTSGGGYAGSMIDKKK